MNRFHALAPTFKREREGGVTACKTLKQKSSNLIVLHHTKLCALSFDWEGTVISLSQTHTHTLTHTHTHTHTQYYTNTPPISFCLYFTLPFITPRKCPTYVQEVNSFESCLKYLQLPKQMNTITTHICRLNKVLIIRFSLVGLTLFFWFSLPLKLTFVVVVKPIAPDQSVEKVVWECQMNWILLAGAETTLAYVIGPSFIGFKISPNKGAKNIF